MPVGSSISKAIDPSDAHASIDRPWLAGRRNAQFEPFEVDRGIGFEEMEVFGDSLVFKREGYLNDAGHAGPASR